MKPTTYCYIFVRYFVEKIILFVFIRKLSSFGLIFQRFISLEVDVFLVRLRRTKIMWATPNGFEPIIHLIHTLNELFHHF